MNRIKLILFFLVIFILIYCKKTTILDNNNSTITEKNKDEVVTEKEEIKTPSPPIKYFYIEEYVMSRGDHGIKVQIEKNQTEENVMKLAEYFQKYGVKNKKGEIEKLTFDGGLRAIYINIPKPKDSKFNSLDFYITLNDIRGMWW